MGATDKEQAVRASAMTEDARWIVTLAVPLALAAAFFVAAVGAGIDWLMVPTIVALPEVSVLALVFLALSSDSNGPVAASTLQPASSVHDSADFAEAA
jgi:hypothetical protein